jgi:arylsulfatase A-like enzyme
MPPTCGETFTIRAQDVAETPRTCNAAFTLVGPTARERVQPFLVVALLSAALEALLWLFLYLRPAPFGSPFALDPAHYVFHAMFYGLWAHLLVALPFVWFARRATGSSPRALWLQLAATSVLLAIGQIDRECQRFLGMHLSVELLRSYAAMDRTPIVIWETLRRDAGGSWSSLWGLAAIAPFPVLASWAARRIALPWLARAGLVRVLVMLGLVLPTALWNVVPGGGQRRGKVRPALLLVTLELTRKRMAHGDPGELARALATLRSHSELAERAPGFRYVDDAYPLLKHFEGRPPAAPSARRPNFVVLSLETFRAKDMASMNPELAGPAPTPFLDGLANAKGSAFYPRYYASGIPTLNAFMAIHTSLPPHPARSMAAEATTVDLRGFPWFLREHGYFTMHHTGSDPDWDSQRVWLSRWYDEVQFHPEDRERDRLTFRRAAERMRAVGRSGQPFLMYIASISNHTPFLTPEPERALAQGYDAITRLHNTMHYTDDVVRELYEAARSEPWFDDTIWIIVGDHGFDLGDRGESGSHDNLRHETTWVPLIVHGRDARLPQGRQSTVASHVDLAPTILELAGIWDDNAFMGRSLLSATPAHSEALIVRSGGFAHETAERSLFQPKEGEAFVYAPGDLSQRTPLAPLAPHELAASRALAEATSTVIAHVIDRDRVYPPRAEARAHAAR